MKEEPKVIVEEMIPQMIELNETLVSVLPSLSKEVEGSIYYSKLKMMLHKEILNFCKEQTELRDDLNFFRQSVGSSITESAIRDYLDSLKEKYNGKIENVGIDYHIEVTRIDYGVSVFCVIKRQNIHMKKFVFRFRKANQTLGLGNLTISGIPLDSLKTSERGE